MNTNLLQGRGLLPDPVVALPQAAAGGGGMAARFRLTPPRENVSMTTSERDYFVAKSRHDAGGADSRAARSPPIAGTAADPLLHSAAYEVPAFRLQRIDRSCGESRKSRTLQIGRAHV